MRGSALATSGFSTARCSSATMGTSSVNNRNTSSGAVSAKARHLRRASARASARRSETGGASAGTRGTVVAACMASFVRSRAGYWVAQDAKRFSSASPWSAQKPTLNCSASFALLAEVGRSASTLGLSEASALVLVGP